MSRIEFRVVEQVLGGSDDPVRTVVPWVDGRSLIDMVRRVELPQARRGREPDLAGSYAGLVDEQVRWPSRHFLGRPVVSWHGGDTVLLGCICGDAGCWPFTAVVTVDARTVTWSDYRTGHRDWTYDDLPVLRFDRGPYEDALRATAD